jgi:uncharacterized phage-associated protein
MKKNEHLVMGKEHPIHYRFDVKKAAQAANKILRLSGGTRNYMEVIKLMCLADREALLQLECPITGDCIVSMERGLVLSHVYDLIKGGPGNEDDAPWFDLISASCDYTIKSEAQCDYDDLSGAELRILEKVFVKYGRMNWKELSRLTHQLPEWVDPGKSSIPVSPEQILKVNGRSITEIQRIRDDAFEYERLDADALKCRQEEQLATIGE